MAAASLDDFCRCCRKLIEKKDKFYLKLFGEKSSSEGIAEAVRKYGDINVWEEDIGAVSTSICLSCYLLVKCIIEKTAKFYSICQNTDEKHFAPALKKSIADRSPSQTAVSPFVLPDLKRRHLESKSSSTNSGVFLFKTILPKPADADENSLDTEVFQNKFWSISR